MKYSLMSLMVDSEIKITKPNFIHMAMAKGMGYEGDMSSLEDLFAFFNSCGVPMKNGTMEFEDLVRFAKESGFDGIDMMSFHFEEDGKKAKEILEKYDMVLSAVNIIVPFVNANTQSKFDVFYKNATEVIDKAYEAGCRNILLMPSVYHPEPGITREQAFQNIILGLKACVAYGQAKGMVINTETLESIGVPLCSNGEMLRLFEAVPGLKYTHDTGNPLVACEDPVATYELFKDKLAAVHFKELAFTEEKTDMMTPAGRYLTRADFGSGEIDFKGHLKALSADNYQGYITLEGTVPADTTLDGAIKTLEYFRNMEEGIV